MWIIKAIYPSGGHTVMFNGEPLKFESKQDALDRAEVLTSTTKHMAAARYGRTNDTTYIVVEEHI